MPKIIARKHELGLFNNTLERTEASFIAIYGRRRIGKTFLVEQYFQDKGLFFHLLGLEKATLHQQLVNFANEFAESFGLGEALQIPENWYEAFNQLRIAAEQRRDSAQKTILFFDEVPWLSSPRSGFLSALEHCWNRYLSSIPNVILIVCGSAASWMIKNIIHNQGGLHGRISDKINLKPFDLHETELFLQSRGIDLNRKQIVDLYLCIGGVAQYLKHVQRGLSSEQNISQLCFRSNGALYHEFDQLYRSLFKNHTAHISVVRALAKCRSGLSYHDIANTTGIPSGGGLSTLLKELTAADFITAITTYEASHKVTKYRLRDEFTLFYLTWMEKQQSHDILDEDPAFWQKQHNAPAWHAWSGYAFEGICMKHLPSIKKSLGISAVQTVSYPWAYHAENRLEDGTEIDVVMDRKDQCIHLFEIKYYDDEFVITKEYAKKLRHKKQVFLEKTKTKKAVFMTLITTHGAKRNEYSLELIDQQLTVDDLFD